RRGVHPDRRRSHGCIGARQARGARRRAQGWSPQGPQTFFMQLNPAESSELLSSKRQSLGVSADTRNQGTVVSVTDGICRIHGLSDVMQGEMIEFPGDTYGLALNLERDSVGAVVLGEYTHISEGDVVKATGRILE